MTKRGLRAALWHRPTLENTYLPLLALLCESKYSYASRERIVNHIKRGGLLVEMVDSGDLWSFDLAAAEEALIEGARWEQKRRAKYQGVSLEPPELTQLNAMLRRA